jgi:hypothetical protein
LLLFQAKNNGSQTLQQESSSKPQLANNKPASTNNKPASTNNKPGSTNNKPASTNNKPASMNNKLTGNEEQDDLSEDNFKPSRYDLFHYATAPTRQGESPPPPPREQNKGYSRGRKNLNLSLFGSVFVLDDGSWIKGVSGCECYCICV